MYSWHTCSVRDSRLLSLLLRLQARGGMSAQALARALEVSVRTIHRDIDRLSAAGVPVWAERGRMGGFRLQPGWSIGLSRLTEGEANALLLAGLPGPAAELGLGSQAVSAQLKLLEALPETLRSQAMRVSARFHLDPIDWYQLKADQRHLSEVADAVWSCRTLRLRYESWKGIKTHDLEPLGLVLKAGVWYLVAQRAGQGADESARTFRLDNILALTVREATFSYPPGFDLAAYWQAATRRFETELYTDTATLRVTARGLKAFSYFHAAVARAARESAAPDPSRRGWQRVTVPIESLEQAAGELLKLGPEAEVLAPRALRRLIQRTISQLGVLYLGDQGAGQQGRR